MRKALDEHCQHLAHLILRFKRPLLGILLLVNHILQQAFHFIQAAQA